MDANIDNILHSDEQLRNTLQSDDKEKLRRKLAHLQREYLKTAQRLKRAECVDALKRHVKNRISLQKDQDQNNPEITSNVSILPCSFTFNINDETPGSLDCQGAVESSIIRRQQGIRFSLSGDRTCSKTPDLRSDIARSHRPSPALRLRSRRSRLRWEKRSANAPEGPDNSQRQQDLTGNTRPGDEEQTIKDEDVFIESEELFADPESESPSLLLTHWSTQEHTQDKTENGNQTSQEEAGKKIDGKCRRSASTTESKGQNARESSLINNKMGEDSVSQSQARKPVACEEGSHDGAQMIAIEKHEDSAEIKEENNQITANKNAVSLLDSCTLVEGLPFPVEYYIRTTRHMTVSQTQPDVQAVIMSQLRAGRQRRSRGRSRRTNQGIQRSDQHTQTDSPSSATPSKSMDSLKLSNVNTSKDYSQSSSDVSTSAISETPVSLRGPSVRPPKGTRRGRGRGRPQRQQLLKQECSLTSGGLQPPLSPALSTQMIHQADETNIEPVLFQQTPTHSCAAQPSSSVSGTPSGFTAEHQEKIYPIFVKSSTSRPQQMNTGSSDCQTLLLPSSSSSSSSLSQTAKLSLPSLISCLMNLDIQQDFHLPDDQFASLKLHKLRQVAVESTPSHNTRRRSSCRHNTVNLLMPCSLPLNSTGRISTIRNSPRPNKSERTSPQQTQCMVTNNLTGTLLNEELCNPSIPVTHAELSPDTLKTSTEAVSLLQEFTEELGAENRVALNSTCTSLNIDEPQALVDRTPRKENDVQLSDEPDIKQFEKEKQPSLEELGLVDGRITQLLSLDFSESKAAEEALTRCTNDATANLPVNNPNTQYPAEDFAEPTKTYSCEDGAIKSNASQSLFKSPLDAVGCPCAGLPSIYHPSLTLASSPVLPSLGITPNAARLTTDSSPHAPPLCLPPSPSPSIQDLSPLDLCPVASITSLPSSLPPPSLCSQLQDLSEPPAPRDQGYREEPDDCLTPSRIQLQGSAVEVGITMDRPAQKFFLRCTHTLEAPAGGSLVDVCCVSDPSAGVCVAAAGKWAVCLWSQTSECNWSLKHTWTFSEPVINVFPVPDSAGLMFVSLGQLEIRQLRLLSCCSLRQMLILEDIIQAVAGLFNSRVGTSSDSATGSTLQVFTLSDSTSLLTPQPLVSPGVCVSALAPVEGLPDALIGTDEVGHLFIWNLKSGQLLSRVLLEDSLSNTTCLKGYSYCGVLLVLLQHQFLSSLDQEEKRAREKCLLSEKRSEPALFSLVGINPLSGRSVLSTWLYPPDGWTGRLCEVDVNRCSVVGLSQSGCVCVWELGEEGMSQMMEAQEDGYWQLVRWGHEDTLVIGHQNGDVSLHPYGVRPTKKGSKADAETPPL